MCCPLLLIDIRDRLLSFIPFVCASKPFFKAQAQISCRPALRFLQELVVLVLAFFPSPTPKIAG